MSIDIRKLLKATIKSDSSDLHLKVGQKPAIRQHGQLRHFDHADLTAEDTEQANSEMMPERLREDLEKKGSVDYSYALTELQRFRINAYYQRGLLSVAIRRISDRPPTIKELGLPAVVKRFADPRKGLALVTGITGAGKSSTLAAIINRINEKRREHIITIEDPIEYLFEDKKCLVDQIEVGFDVIDFPYAMRNALRQDPDVIVFGEFRDRETIETGLHAVESGHLVFGTMHTPDTKQTLMRILHFFPSDIHRLLKEDLALNLFGVISQRLLRRADGNGRVPVCEVLFASPIVRKLIREDRIEDIQQVLTNGEDDMQSFDIHLAALVKDAIISMDEALLYVHDEGSFRRRLKGVHAAGDRRSLIG